VGGWCGEQAVSNAVVVVSTEVSDRAMLHLTSSLKQQHNPHCHFYVTPVFYNLLENGSDELMLCNSTCELTLNKASCFLYLM